MKLWILLNGNKTIIGTVLLIIARILDIIDLETLWAEKVIEILYYLGMGFGGVGLGHKKLKQIDKSEL